jgi:NAD(P)-dependent dehydrogenase (short-subunit alcohol dehydrogenase family)
MTVHQETSLVFGGHSPIAIAISKQLSLTTYVKHFSRKVDIGLKRDLPESTSFSLTSWGAFKHILDRRQKSILLSSKCTNLIFSHKYISKQVDPLEQFSVEVLFPIAIIEFLITNELFNEDSNIIFLTSPASNFIVDDQSLNYHISKAGINQVTKYFGAKLGARSKVNAISPGSFVMKNRNRDFFKNNQVFKLAIEEFLPLKKITDVEDIALLVEFLVSKQNKVINGQIIDVSGGYLNFEPSHIFRKSYQ